MRRMEEALFRCGWPPRFARRFALGMALATLSLPASAAAAGPQPEPYGAHDAGGFRNVLPPAQGTDANTAQIGAFELNGTYPPHTNDQLDMYSNLVYAVGADQGL